MLLTEFSSKLKRGKERKKGRESERIKAKLKQGNVRKNERIKKKRIGRKRRHNVKRVYRGLTRGREGKDTDTDKKYEIFIAVDNDSILYCVPS